MKTPDVQHILWQCGILGMIHVCRWMAEITTQFPTRRTKKSPSELTEGKLTHRYIKDCAPVHLNHDGKFWEVPGPHGIPDTGAS